MHSIMSQAIMTFDDGVSVYSVTLGKQGMESENIYSGKTNDITCSRLVMLSQVGPLFLLNAHATSWGQRLKTQSNWEDGWASFEFKQFRFRFWFRVLTILDVNLFLAAGSKSYFSMSFKSINFDEHIRFWQYSSEAFELIVNHKNVQ